MNNSTFDKIMELIREFEGIDQKEVSMDTTFEELELDSLDVVEILMSCEEEFGISVEIEEPPKTVGDFVNIIDSLRGIQ